MCATPAASPAAVARGQRAAVAGVTLMELMLAISVAGILSAVALPKIRLLTGSNKAGRAAQIVQQDLERAYVLASRLRRPVVLTADNAHMTYQVRDQVGDTLRLNRYLKGNQEFGLETMTFSPASITIQPNGVASDTLGVTLRNAGSTHKISVSRVGLVRRTQ